LDIGKFYFINDQYFIDFPDKYLLRNKESTNGVPHGRPCFYAIYDQGNKIYWMIPISSQVAKYHKIYTRKINIYGKCDTIVFGNVLGYRKAFLIQNMCPVITPYIDSEYIDGKAGIPVTVDGVLETELMQKASKVLALERKYRGLIFPNVFDIESKLKKFMLPRNPPHFQ
jgi:hypothetical protein